LVDDGHAFFAGTVVVVKVPAREDRDTERCEVLRGNVSQPTRRAFFAVRGLVPLCHKLQPCGTAVAPGHAPSDCDTLHAWQLADPPGGFPEDTLPRPVAYAWRDYRWKVDRQYPSQVIAGVRGLQCRQRGDQHAGARKQHERTRDLRRGKNPQTAV